MTPQSKKHPVHRQTAIKCPKCSNALRPSVDVAAREVTEESAQSLYCGRCGHEQWAKRKEPWNFKKFVRHYNEIAREQSGWVFDPTDNEQNPPDLQAMYEGLDGYPKLHDYAKRRFMSDQLWNN